jgi:hypothetical protein
MVLGALASVLGCFDDAERLFTEAEELNTAGGMRFGDAKTKMLWGRMLHQRGGPGDAERARALLAEARDMAAAGGYAAIERRAIVELSKIV